MVRQRFKRCLRERMDMSGVWCLVFGVAVMKGDGDAGVAVVV